MKTKINIPKTDCPKCMELVSTDCIISEVTHPFLGLTSGQTLTRIIKKIVLKLKGISKRVMKDYKLDPEMTGEKWIDGKNVYRVVIEIENTTAVTTSITKDISMLAIGEILTIDYVNLSTTVTNDRLVSYDKATTEITSIVEANTKNLIILKYV